MKRMNLIVVILLVALITSCTENESVTSKSAVNKSELNRLGDENELGYYFPYSKMNWNGNYLVGANGLLSKDCDRVPNGWCVGMLEPLPIRTLSDKDVMYIDVIDENLVAISVGIDHGYTVDSIYQDLINGGATQEFAEIQAPFILNHFSFSNNTEIVGELKNEILSLGNYESGARVIIQEGDYELLTNDYFPNGYFKVPITIE